MTAARKKDASNPRSNGARNSYLSLLWVPALILTAGCRATQSSIAPLPDSPKLVALYTNESVTPDGRLEEAIWDLAPAHPLSFSQADSPEAEPPSEPGTVRLAWDNKYLYAAFELKDSDVIEEGDADQLQQQRTGDVAELFLKPQAANWYWEFHVTPRGRSSAFFFPSRGRAGLPSNFEHPLKILAGATVDGTLNEWSDQDAGWTAEIAIPLRELTVLDERFDPTAEWRALAARYNYAVNLPAPELSSSPRLPRTSFHDHDNYGSLHYQKH